MDHQKINYKTITVKKIHTLTNIALKAVRVIKRSLLFLIQLLGSLEVQVTKYQIVDVQLAY